MDCVATSGPKKRGGRDKDCQMSLVFPLSEFVFFLGGGGRESLSLSRSRPKTKGCEENKFFLVSMYDECFVEDCFNEELDEAIQVFEAIPPTIPALCRAILKYGYEKLSRLSSVIHANDVNDEIPLNIVHSATILTGMYMFTKEDLESLAGEDNREGNEHVQQKERGRRLCFFQAEACPCEGKDEPGSS